MQLKAILFTLLNFVGFVSWWSITGATYDANWEDDDVADDLSDGDAFEVCAGSGAALSIVAFVISFLAGGLAIANSFMQNDLKKIEYSDDHIVCGP